MKNNHIGNVVFIPDYVHKSLLRNGVTLEHLATASSAYGIDNVTRSKTANDMSLLLNKLSGNDIADIILANDLIYKQLMRFDSTYKLGFSKTGMLGYISDELRYMDQRFHNLDNKTVDFINAYFNNNIDINTISMSILNVKDNKLLDISIVDNTIFVILHDGFTNFIVYKDLEFTKSLCSLILDYTITMFGEKEAYKSCFFHWFMSLTKKIKN